MKHLIHLTFIPFSIVLMFIVCMGISSCDSYDSWTVSPNARLQFSTDTVSFDTVISTHTSVTRTLMVFNRNKDGVRINQVRVKEGGRSHFRVNVDGQYLYDGMGSDFEVRGEDSIFIKIETTLPEGGTEEVVHFEDFLLFTLESGVEQQVVLDANALDVVTFRSKVITADTTLTAGKPFLIYDSLVVAEGAKLTLEPGVRMLFHDGVSLHVHGTLDARGTLDQPVIFRGDRLDRMFDYLPYDNTTRRWGGIHFFGESQGNVMQQCDVHSGDYGIICDSLQTFDPETPALRIENSIIHNVAGDGLRATCTHVEVIGTQISNTLGYTVYQLGGASTFVHCTLAQFYPWSGDRLDALFIADQLEATPEGLRPLTRAHFLNCVITGYADDVIMGELAEEGETPTPYLFSHCLLRTVKSEDAERFVEIVYDDKDLEPNGTKHFRLFDTDNFLYDFTPDTLSQIRDKADIELTKRYSPIDRRGNSRLADDGPDMGCYEFVPQQVP